MKNHKLVVLLAWLGTALAPVSNGAAQAPPAATPAPEEAALDATRARSGIAANDPTIDAWITYRVNLLNAGISNPKPGEDAMADFLKACQSQAGNSANTKDFNNRLAEQCGKRFAAEFEKGQDLEPMVAMALARALLAFENTEAMPGLAAGLRAKARPTVRYYCAKALAGLIPAIQADERLTGVTLQLLREVASQETSGVVLGQMYEAMAYKERLAAALPAALDVLDAQLRRRAKDSPGADGASEPLFSFFKKELANLSEKNRLAAALAIHLRLDVERYGTQGVSEDEKRIIERTIDAVEVLLVQIVGPAASAPNVREAMKKVQNADINMPLELYKWIGTPQNRGVLNEAPWNVPVAAPIPG